MKKRKYLLVLLLFCSLAFVGQAQDIQQVTPYEKLPSSQVDLKPTYDDDLPQWAKMLYQYPVNMRDIDREFRIWEQKELKRTGLPKIKNSLVRYYKIWRKSLIQYVDVNGKINLPDTEKLYQELIESQKASYLRAQGMQKAPQAGNNSNWTLLGPKNTYNLNGGDGNTSALPWQVNIYSFDVAPSNHDVLFAGTETGYVNKTVDKGENWTLCARDYHFGGSVKAVAIHPTNPDVVYVGAGGTVHRSVDGGNSWQRTTPGNIGSINHIKIDKNNPNKIFATTDKGIYMTTNGADNWTRPSAYGCWDIEFKPDDSNILFAITAENSRYKILRSSDGGSSWSIDNSFTPNLIPLDGGLLAVTEANPNVLYATFLTKTEGNRPYIYKGVLDQSGSITWVLKHKGSNAGFTANAYTNGQGYFDLVLEASPEHENVIFVGTTTLFKSVNGGEDLRTVGGYQGPFSIHPDMQDMKVLGYNETWIATDGGLTFTPNMFNHNDMKYEAKNQGLVGSDFWGFDQGWNEDICVGGRYHNGNTAIADFYNGKALRLGGGESATGWVIKGKKRHVVFNDLGSGMILPETATGTLEGRFPFTPKQADGGHHPNMDSYGASRSNLYPHPYYSSILYSGSDNAIWISKDYGKTFDMLKEFGGRIKYLNSSFVNPDVMYVDVAGQGFYRSGDGGKTWVKKRKPTSWNARISFVISPYNADVLYAGYQDGKGVYRSEDGGSTWVRWSPANTISTKSLAIQPTSDGKDLVYAFASRGDVYMKKEGDANWTEFNTNYPKGLLVNIALPFYRDSKLRVAGNAGVWETPFAEEDFAPVIVPWVEKKEYGCKDEIVQFDCHSMLNHAGATWTWSFSKEPEYISDKNSRNPKVRFAEAGKYDVTLTVTQGGKTYSKTVENMVEIKPCPSLDRCDNPAVIPQIEMRLIEVDSYQPGNEGGKAFDGNISTIWHTKWGFGQTNPPHYISIDLGREYKLSKMHYLPRKDGTNGTIQQYKLYISKDKNNWGTPVKSGSFEKASGMNNVSFPETVGRYVKLVAVSEIQQRAWTSIAELSFTGCYDDTGLFDVTSYALEAFPIPANNIINVSLPFNNGVHSFEYYVVSATGQYLESGKLNPTDEKITLNVSNYPTGNYFVIMRAENGTLYRVKFIKN